MLLKNALLALPCRSVFFWHSQYLALTLALYFFIRAENCDCIHYPRPVKFSDINNMKYLVDSM